MKEMINNKLKYRNKDKFEVVPFKFKYTASRSEVLSVLSR